MINLIPNKDKKVMIIDFYIRFISTMFFVLGFGGLIACVSLVPAFVLSIEKKSSVDMKLKTQTEEVMPEIDQQALGAINDLNSKMDIIEKAKKGNYEISQKVIKAILLKKINGIQITQIAYKSDALGIKSVNVNGKASSREQLLSFRQSFESDKAFSKVVLPISNFVKGSNIQFSLSLTPA